MSWLVFYLSGFIFMLSMLISCVKYEELKDLKSAINYFVGAVLLSFLSWVAVLICIYGANIKNDK